MTNIRYELDPRQTLNDPFLETEKGFGTANVQGVFPTLKWKWPRATLFTLFRPSLWKKPLFQGVFSDRKCLKNFHNMCYVSRKEKNYSSGKNYRRTLKLVSLSFCSINENCNNSATSGQNDMIFWLHSWNKILRHPFFLTRSSKDE